MTPSSAGLAPLAEALGWPRVLYSPQYPIEGKEEWRSALSRANAGVERRRLYDCLIEHLGGVPGIKDASGELRPWAGPELLVTEDARVRVKRWHDAGEPETSAEDIAVVSTPRLAAQIRQTIQELPPPVRFHLAAHAVIVAIGDGTGGYCITEPARSSVAVEARQWLTINADHESDVPSITLHEAAHSVLAKVWPLDSIETPTEATDRRERRRVFVSCAAQFGLLQQLSDPLERDERQACRLARTWGATGAAADGARCASNRRRILEAEAAEAAAACAGRASE